MPDPFTLHRRLAVARRDLERAAWDANPTSQLVVEGFEVIATDRGVFPLSDLSDRELRALAAAKDAQIALLPPAATNHATLRGVTVL